MSLSTATDNSHKTPVACACQKFEIENWLGEVPEGADPGDFVEYIGTGCVQSTARTFAPGHDAKLKSLLIQAGARGLGVRYGSVNSDAMKVANRFGFGHQVLAGIDKAQARAEERAAKKSAKSAKPAKQPKAASKPLVQPVTIKVGRWTYEAIINPADNSAEYTSANGQLRTAEPGKYQLVTA